jgi:putative endonuclease
VSIRLIRHNQGNVAATRNGVPWQLQYTERFATRTEALKRELEIKKKKSRKYIVWLISDK